MNKEEIENKIRDTVYDFLAEDERFYGKQDGTESITKVPERLIKELSTLIKESNEETEGGWVDGFWKQWVEGADSLGFDKYELLTLKNAIKFYEEYLSSIGKEDKNE